MKDEKIKIAVIITAVILLLSLLIGSIVSLTRSDDEGSTPTLYVKYNEEKLETGSEVELEIGETVRFDVGYDLDFISGQNGYHVKVMPRITEETDFTYTVDGTQKKFSDLPALTNTFNVVAEEGAFTLKANGDLPTIIASLYNAIYTVEGVPNAANTGKAYFTLVVLSADQTESVEIHLKLTGEEERDPEVTGITVSPGEIVF